MGESHAFGATFLCGPSRRHFVMAVCVLMTLLCAARILYFVIVFSSQVDVEPKVSACTGEDCFQVFTCLGLQEATVHTMEPLLTVSGILFFPLGFHAAHHGDDVQMKRFGLYLLAANVLRVAVMVGDLIFLHNCQMYDANMMSMVLSLVLPPSPLRVGVQEKLRALRSFPVEIVDVDTNGFNITAWYLTLSILWTAFLLYVTLEALALSSLMQYGLLGLGVHYGLDQWDEELNRTAIRRKVQSSIRSKFMDDAQLPLSQGNHVGQLQGSRSYGTYGAYASFKESSADFSTQLPFPGRGPHYEVEMEEDENEAEAVRQLAEKLSREESPEAILDRAFFD